MKKIMIMVVLTLFVWVGTKAQTTAPATQPSKEYVETLKKMMQISGADLSFKMMVPQMFAAIKQQLPNVPADALDAIQAEVEKTALDDLITMMAPVYEKQLTKTDLEEIIKFYETPIGKKLAAAQPLIMQGSMQIGQQWGQQVVMKIQKMLQDKGYLPMQ
ncbi:MULTISPECIES: DUF2059 domain-containing protein [Porphyromonadaceae]|uniref:DUF2059 domain-containing protein n=1 Tax=Sanguibacteroides justesenii TaxID=1547597 RepID=A0AB34R8H3_9PORP|nr:MULTISPECIES: DUF2059 domain-containing protein [Porphyromonadaceae]KIO45051.1 hypothetical protein IE90_06300 [Sanguibacteroides justesenii]